MIDSESNEAKNKKFRHETARQQFESPTTPSPERSQEIERRLIETVRALSDFQSPWYIGGGLALDLHNSSFERDHDDVDIALSLDSATALWEYAQLKGWSFYTHEDVQLSTPEKFYALAQQGNEGIVIQLETGSLFEVVFIKTDKSGSLTGPARISLHDEPYKHNAENILVNGEEVTLTPPEIVLLYKILDGRHKDFIDVANYLPKLSEQQRDRFDTYLGKLRPSFEIAGEQISGVDELMQVARTKNGEVFDQYINDIEQQERDILRAKDRQTAEKLLNIAQCIERDSFFDSLTKEFGPGSVDRYTSELEKIESILFSGEPVTVDQLYDSIQKIFGRELYLAQRINMRMQLLTRWNTTINPIPDKSN